ncbi:MAG TPA: DUF1573 domain-containing protein [Methylomirabilota bacterium]|nr:DUF1573 domain-containing protein [Methylomirabilota bacterium]
MRFDLLPKGLRSCALRQAIFAMRFLVGLSLLVNLGCSSPGEEPVAVAQSAPQAETATPAPSGPPRIVFHDPVFDFGKVEQGAQVNHLFRFTNQGGQDLRIESVKTSCGCTAAVISAEVIPPGQEGTISATFDTTHFSGEKAKSVSVYSNDPAQPVTTLTLQGEITVEVAVDPPQLYLGRVRRGEETVRSVDVLYDAAKPIAITKIENSSPLLTVRAQDLEKDGQKGKKLIVTLKKDAPLGRLNDEIRVTTTSEKRPVVEIPVFGSVEGDLVLAPPQVSFGVVRQGEGKTQEVSIKNRSAKPIHIVNVESSNADIAPTLTTVKDGEEYKLTLNAKSDSKAGRIQGEVKLFTDHPDEKMLAIPLYGMVSAAQQAKQ